MPLLSSRHLLLAALCCAPLLAASPARANCCVFEDPLVAVSDVAARSGALRLSLDGESSASSAAMDAMPGLRHEVAQTTLRLFAVYSPVELLNVVVVAPFARRAWRAVDTGMGMATVTDSGTQSGIGDLDVGVRYALWRRVRFIPRALDDVFVRAEVLALSAGASLPTGDADASRDGQRLDQMLQIGSGAWGPYLGLTYRWRQEAWDVVLSGSGRLRTRSANDYRYGNALYLGAEVQYLAIERVTLGIGLDGRAAGRDVEMGDAVRSSGGLILYAAPSVSVGLGEGFALRARGQLPLAARLGGDQAVAPSWLIGLQYAVR
ncbi:MAG: transporter [Anaeromyxobacteraceae bacterium]